MKAPAPKVPATEPGPLLVLLSFATGATDGFAFLALGGIFTANMTGNLVLLALFHRSTWVHTAIGATTAILTFALALGLAFRISGPRRSLDGGVLKLLGIAFALQLATFFVWHVDGGLAPTFGLQVAVIALSSAAMAVQTAAARRAGDDRSISTTFVTGTLTGLVQDIADGVAGERWVRFWILLALPAGALVSALVMIDHPGWGALLTASTGPGAARHSLLQRTCRAQPLASTIETHPAVNPAMPQGHQKAALRPTMIVITTIRTRPIAPRRVRSINRATEAGRLIVSISRAPKTNPGMRISPGAASWTTDKPQESKTWARKATVAAKHTMLARGRNFKIRSCHLAK